MILTMMIVMLVMIRVIVMRMKKQKKRKKKVIEDHSKDSWLTFSLAFIESIFCSLKRE